ncbi:hypothetical protein HAX54_047233, partial [Datura stramonium]|nr:hypothetical protein [Datura stramonium]
ASRPSGCWKPSPPSGKIIVPAQGEQDSGTAPKLNHAGITFIENDIPEQGEIDTPSESNPLDISGSSGSNSTIDNSISQSHPRRTQIPHRLFEIKGETFIVTYQDEEDPQNINEALTCRQRKNDL